MSLSTSIREEVLLELETLSKTEFGSEEYKTGVNGIAQLTDRLIEMDKMDSEYEKLELERQKLDFEADKFEEERKDRKTKNRISVLGIVVPSSIAIIGGIAMFVYEERGSITSQAGRKIIDKYIFRVK